MKHLFIPYELALLAKEKGFDEEVLRWWNKNKSITNSAGSEGYERLKAPLYQQIIDWFRDKHKIVIQATYVGSTEYFDKFIPDIYALEIEENDDETTYNYYGALNNAIEEAFKLI